MPDLRGNPWSFVAADQAATAAITSITRQGQGSALVQLTAPLTGLAQDIYVSIQGAAAGWNRGYRVLALGAAANSFYVNLVPSQYQLANSGAAGAAFTWIYHELIEVTQMLWDNPTAGGTLLVTDQFGRTVWNPNAPTAGGPLTYMKAFPIDGLVLNTIPSGILQISI